MPIRIAALVLGFVAGLFQLVTTASAQDWQRNPDNQPGTGTGSLPQADPNRRPLDGSIRPLPRTDAYRPPGQAPIAQGYGQPYPAPPPTRYGEPYSAPPPPSRYGEPYTAPPPSVYEDPRARNYEESPPPGEGGFTSNEILAAGHSFFGSISKGLAGVIEYSFKSKGRPNGYILGQDAGGALIAGLRYGEGVLYTRDAGTHRVYWQGPSIGWDAGAEGSKVMVLVYNLRDPEQIYQRFAGVAGSAYIIGGVGITFQESDDILVAPIRAGVGLRIGANVGYLKYTRRPTWNPF